MGGAAKIETIEGVFEDFMVIADEAPLGPAAFHFWAEMNWE
jgi:hypothetical protein